MPTTSNFLDSWFGASTNHTVRTIHNAIEARNVVVFVTPNQWKQSILHHTRSRYYNLDDEGVYTLARIEKLISEKFEEAASILRKLAESYFLKVIFTMDVTKLAFRSSVVAY